MNNNYQDDKFPVQKALKWGAALVVLIALWLFSGNLYENLDNKEVMVIQSPFSGQLNVFTSPGLHWQGFGHVTKYRKSFQYWFDGKHSGEGGPSIPIKFNDGGHADIPGSIRVDFPLDVPSIIKIHTKYGSQEAVENQLVATVLAKSVYMAGPTMTSKEAYAEKKNQLLFYVEDQALHGVYKTQQRDVELIDPMTGQKRAATIVDLVQDSTGHPLRMESSLVAVLNITLSNLSFGDFAWDETVKKQIAAQQQATAQVSTAIAKAKEAEQQAITTEQQGKATAAQAKWDQETANAKIVAEADGRRRAAEQDALAAASEKNAKILRAQGESEAMRLKTVANNNFDKKAELWLEAQKVWADAFAKHQGALVPTTVFGGSGSGGGNAATTFMDLMSMKAAKDLNVEIGSK